MFKRPSLRIRSEYRELKNGAFGPPQPLQRGLPGSLRAAPAPFTRSYGNSSRPEAGVAFRTQRVAGWFRESSMFGESLACPEDEDSLPNGLPPLAGTVISRSASFERVYLAVAQAAADPGSLSPFRQILSRTGQKGRYRRSGSRCLLFAVAFGRTRTDCHPVRSS